MPQLVMYLHSALDWALLGMHACRWWPFCLLLMLHCMHTLLKAVLSS